MQQFIRYFCTRIGSDIMTRQKFLIWATCLLMAINGWGQQVREVININHGYYTTTLRSTNDIVRPEGAERSRAFDYNPRLRQLTTANRGDTLWIDLFEDIQYKAVITDVTVDYDNVLGITACIAGYDFASCILSVSKAGISLRADIPTLNKHYRIANLAGQPVLSQYSLSANLVPDQPMPPFVKPAQQTGLPQLRAIEDPDEHTIIDVMVVYSVKAKEWADKNATSIDNAISLAFQYANHVLDNSEVNLTFRVVRKYETDYAESTDANMDLTAFRDNGDGIMDEVHEMRREYGADLVVLMPMTGAWAYLPNYDLNKPDASFGFSVCNIGGSTYGSTLIHELGHNLGAHHHWQQLPQRFPGPGIFIYSSAWRGVDEDGQWLHTVMSYDGNSFADKNPSVLIPYFSNPEVIVNGVAIGSMAKENNALTLNQTKHVIARYSELIGSKNPATGTAVITDDALKVYAADGGVFVSGIHPGESLQVFNLSGLYIYKCIAISDREYIALSEGGFYIVVAGGRSFKIFVK